MWKVAVVQPVTEGFGFNITTETNVQLVSFAYATRAEAEAAATHAQAVVEKPFRCFQSSTRSLGADGGPFYWICGTDEGGAARIPQRLLTYPRWVALAGAGYSDDFPGNQFGDRIPALGKLETRSLLVRDMVAIAPAQHRLRTRDAVAQRAAKLAARAICARAVVGNSDRPRFAAWQEDRCGPPAAARPLSAWLAQQLRQNAADLTHRRPPVQMIVGKGLYP